MEAKDKIALITGANKGIGFEVAKQLSKAGCTVLMTARDKKLGQAACEKLKGNGAKVEFIELDLLSPETIERAATEVERKHGRLDILVNNAAIVDRADGFPSKATAEAVEKTIKTNFIGPLRVTQAMLPLLKKSKEASIVNVSSGLGSLELNGGIGTPYSEVKFLGYCSSKAALNMMTVHFAYELRNTPIKVNSADPGYTATDLNDNQGHQTVEEGAAETVRLALIGADGPTGKYSDRNGALPW
jgi:NAD(P)-dependent dehydrogenase (short-subunit alcohol dehydrogenase family)